MVLGLLASCGQGVRQVQSTPTVRTLLEPVMEAHVSKTPIFLQSQSNDCHSQFTADTSLDYSLNLLLGGIQTRELRNFSGIITGDGELKGDGSIITSTTYGLYLEKTIDLNTGKYSKPHIRHTEAKPVKVCSDQFEYDSKSVESAGLNAAYVISKTYRNILAAVPGLHIPPITVSITPKIKRVTKGTFQGQDFEDEAYETDNAFYNPNTSEITFLPHSPSVSVKFWEIPMVGSHEYGHHIFSNIMTNLRKIYLPANRCFDNRQDFTTENLTNRKVTNFDVMMALNEGFADMISFYTLSDSERGVQGIDCLKINRDVNSAVFTNLEPKVFSSTVLNKFFTTDDDWVLNGESGCNNPSYKSPHIIGAIFASNADRFMEKIGSTKQQRLQVLIAWIKAMNANLPSQTNVTPQIFLEESYQTFLKVMLEKFDKTFDQTICNQIGEFYPDLKSKIAECSN